MQRRAGECCRIGWSVFCSCFRFCLSSRVTRHDPTLTKGFPTIFIWKVVQYTVHAGFTEVLPCASTVDRAQLKLEQLSADHPPYTLVQTMLPL